MSADDEKRAVGAAAALMVEDGMTVGLGTGSTAAAFVEALASRVAAGELRIRGVGTSTLTEAQATRLGVPLLALDEAGEIDLTVDGADEVGPGLALIKGAGGALLREKLVWEASRRCVVIADSAKRVATLGAFPLSVEVVAFGHLGTARRISDALAACDLRATPRLRLREGAPFRTDGGNVIYDLDCGAIPHPDALAAALDGVTGVVEHGLFLDLADLALIGGPGGVERLEP